MSELIWTESRVVRGGKAENNKILNLNLFFDAFLRFDDEKFSGSEQLHAQLNFTLIGNLFTRFSLIKP